MTSPISIFLSGGTRGGERGHPEILGGDSRWMHVPHKRGSRQGHSKQLTEVKKFKITVLSNPDIEGVSISGASKSEHNSSKQHSIHVSIEYGGCW